MCDVVVVVFVVVVVVFLVLWGICVVFFCISLTTYRQVTSNFRYLSVDEPK